MLEGFKARKPWAAAIIGLLLGPIIGMCYINRGRNAVIYLFISIFSAMLPFLATPINIPFLNPIGIQVIGAIHCFRVAKHRDATESLKWYSRWYALVGIIMVPLLLSLTFRHLCYEPFHMPSSSMSPNINKDDYFFAQKFAYNPPERGDVIVFKLDNVSFIKRVIGLPGDKIHIKQSVVYINDIAIPRKPIEDFTAQDSRITHQFIETLPNGKEYKILGESKDSPMENTVLYTVPAYHYFVLGDNRDQSHDTRDQDKFGFILQENITGKASTVVWNTSKQKLEWLSIN